MKSRTCPLAIAALFAALTLIFKLQAQPLVNIETVTVGDAGNAADTLANSGAVAYVFAIGKYEVTIGQYTSFLNSAASVTSDGYIVDLWNENMAFDLNIAGIGRSGDGTLASPYIYSVIGSGSRPISYVNWFDAARFANWINNGATNGASTETGAYTLDGATSGIFLKNPDAKWWIPSEDEWHKAAYYKGGGTNAGYWVYPTQSDTAPGNNIGGATNQANYYAGDFAVTQESGFPDSTQNYLTDAGVFSNGASAYGTFDQGGNVAELNQDVEFFYSSGGSWLEQEGALSSPYRWEENPSGDGNSLVGFRVATVPEPSTYGLVLMGAGALWFWRRRKSTL